MKAYTIDQGDSSKIYDLLIASVAWVPPNQTNHEN